MAPEADEESLGELVEGERCTVCPAVGMAKACMSGREEVRQERGWAVYHFFAFGGCERCVLGGERGCEDEGEGEGGGGGGSGQEECKKPSSGAENTADTSDACMRGVSRVSGSGSGSDSSVGIGSLDEEVSAALLSPLDTLGSGLGRKKPARLIKAASAAVPRYATHGLTPRQVLARYVGISQRCVIVKGFGRFGVSSAQQSSGSWEAEVCSEPAIGVDGLV